LELSDVSAPSYTWTEKSANPDSRLEFKGNVKENAKKLPYVVAAWHDLGFTRIVVRCLANSDKDYRAAILQRLENEIGKDSENVYFSDTGCDIIRH
jgi:hypothetical protein